MNTRDTEQTGEWQRTEIRVDQQFEENREQLAMKTNENGILHANFITTNPTKRDEKFIIHVFLEDCHLPFKLEFNGVEADYLMIDVPREGKVEVDFTLSGLPAGKHLLFICSEKVIDEKIPGELEMNLANRLFLDFCFSLYVQNGYIHLLKKNDRITPVTVISSSYNETSYLQLFEDSNLSREVSSINKKRYFLVIRNSEKFAMMSQLIVMYTINLKN